MTQIVAIYSTGTLTWTDGAITGDDALAWLLKDPIGDTGPLTPEGPAYPVAAYQTDPWAFVAISSQLTGEDPELTLTDMPDSPVAALPDDANVPVISSTA